MPPESSISGRDQHLPVAPTSSAAPSGTQRERLLIIGLGNEFISDDGVGIHAVRSIRQRLLQEHGSRLPDSLAILELSVGGIQLLDALCDSDRCLIIDALRTGDAPPGSIRRFDQVPGAGQATITSSHQLDLPQLLMLARALGAKTPRTITIYGIETEDITTFADHCTGAVAAALPRLVDLVCTDVRRFTQSDNPENV